MMYVAGSKMTLLLKQVKYLLLLWVTYLAAFLKIVFVIFVVNMLELSQLVTISWQGSTLLILI